MKEALVALFAGSRYVGQSGTCPEGKMRAGRKSCRKN